MHIVAGLMVIIFALCGAGLFYSGITSLVSRKRLSPTLLRIQGKVRRIESKTMSRSSSDTGHSRPTVVYFPVIEYTDPQGVQRTFRSESGKSAATRDTEPWVIGEPMGILYDPSGTLTPMIDSWFGLYGAPAMMLLAGPIFCGASVLIVFAFGQKIVEGFGY